jgi:hypothetical protein
LSIRLATVLALAALACSPAPPRGNECLNAPVLRAPETGCTVIGLEVAGEDTCAMVGVTSHRGSWLELRHPADRAATLSIRLVTSPPRCDAPGAVCPTAHFTQGGVVPCACDFEGLDSLNIASAPLEVRLSAPEQSVLLAPPGAVYEISLCVDGGDAFPTCEASGECAPFNTFQTEGHCACLPACVTDDDCPQPRSGTVSARCEPVGCTLPCGADEVCPDGQACIARSGSTDSICMAPL